jgi:hypothetical protein
MLLCYSSLEAYVNFLGPSLCPDEWADERAFFSKGKYQGTLGKLALLTEKCGLVVSRDRRPWQTLKELNRRRDAFMHPRSESWDLEVSYSDPSELERVDPELLGLVDEAFVDKVMNDLQAICDPLHQAAGKAIGGGPAFGIHAFVGMSGHQGGSLL